MPRILIVLTSHATLGDTGRHTGFFWEELAVPYAAFRRAGMEVELASIAGGRPPPDPASLTPDVPKVAAFLADPIAMAALAATIPVAQADADRYDAVFLPGGHGAMWDFPADAALTRLIERICDRGRVVGAVCHGAAGLVGVLRVDGKPVVAGRRVSAFTDAEEVAAGLAYVVPFLLESRLRSLRAAFESGPDWEPFAVRDGTLVTGQNPASSVLVAALMVQVLEEQARRASAGVSLMSAQAR